MEPFDVATGKAAETLGVSQSTVVRWAEAGQLSGFKTPGGHWKFRRSDVEAFIAARSQVTS